MISLINVSKSYRTQHQHVVILHKASMRIEPRQRVGILAKSGSGKTTIGRLLTGVEAPDRGRIIRTRSISWPLGFSGALHPALSCCENVAVAAGLYNLDATELSLRVEHFAELGRGFYAPLGALSPGQRNQLGMALSLSVHFDMYLADEFSAVGTPAFQDKIEAALEGRMTRSGLILLTRHPHTIRRLAKRVFALAGGSLIECASADEASDVLKIYEQEETAGHAA